MNGTTTITEDISERVSNGRMLEQQWDLINWELAQNYVNRLQSRIAKATQVGKKSTVKRLQYLLTHSFYAKAMAVKKVTTNKGKKTAGIDGEIWSTKAAKMNAIKSLNCRNYRAKAVKRVFIEKKGTNKRRPLGIPCMYDRAMQALYTLSLEPISEITADRNSFGFRQGRCAQDACSEIFGVMSQKRAAKYALEGDIKGCFDNISHKWLLDNIPMDKDILGQFLKAGYVYKGQMFPANEGAAQGSIIGPVLANMTLDGLQELLYSKFRITHREANKNKVNFIRYADDFIVTAATELVAQEARALIAEFLKQRGLELSEEKTVITHIDKGFDFLGWNFRKYREKMIIMPSQKSVKSILTKITATIKDGVAMEQDTLIARLNPIVRGWANYHQSVCSKSTFQRIGHETFECLWKWAKRRHPNKGRGWKRHRYWQCRGTRSWVFATDINTLCNPAYIPIVRHPRLKTELNPHLSKQYFIKRQKSLKLAKENAKRVSALNRVCNA